KSPNCNAHLEHFFRSLKDETLSRVILFGKAALFNAIEEFLAHYHRERAHQGLGHRRPRETTRSADGGADQLSLSGRKRKRSRECPVPPFYRPQFPAVLRELNSSLAWFRRLASPVYSTPLTAFLFTAASSSKTLSVELLATP